MEAFEDSLCESSHAPIPLSVNASCARDCFSLRRQSCEIQIHMIG